MTGCTASECSNAIATTTLASNEGCVVKCLDYGADSSAFREQCKILKNCHPTAIMEEYACFDNLVLGDITKNLNGRKKYTETAALCQSACQQEKNCYRFTWTIPGTGAEPKKCTLQTKDVVEAALATKLYREERDDASIMSADKSKDYPSEPLRKGCPSWLARFCRDQVLSCYTREDYVRCGYYSLLHISGPRACIEAP